MLKLAPLEFQVPLWLEIEEEKNLNIKEFAELFSRQVTERKPTRRKDETQKQSKIQPAKILDSKRSKMVGILEKSLHLDFSEVENAVYNLDTSVVHLGALHQIYEVVSVYNQPNSKPFFYKLASSMARYAREQLCLRYLRKLTKIFEDFR